MKPIAATFMTWILPFIVVGMLLVLLFNVDNKVNKPEYQQHVEFKQFLESIKDQPFTITIDGKKHMVTIGELKNGN